MSTEHRLEIPLPAGTRVVPTLAIPLLVATAFHPGADPNSTGFQAALRSHTRLLDKAARDGTVRVVSFYGEPLDLSATGFAVAGAHVTVDELCRYLAGLPVPVALRIGEPELQGAKPPARALQVSEQHAEIVLAQIWAAGYDPMDLPPRVTGESWVKAEIRERCQSLQDSQFDRAWKALRRHPARIKERE